MKSTIEHLIPANYASDRPVLMRPCFRPSSVKVEDEGIYLDHEDALRYFEALKVNRQVKNKEPIYKPIERADIIEILVDLCGYVGYFENQECLKSEYIKNVAFSEENIIKWVLEHGMPSYLPSYRLDDFRVKAHILLATMASWQALKEGSFSRLKLACDGVLDAAESWLSQDEELSRVGQPIITEMVLSVPKSANYEMYMLDTAFDKTIRAALFLHGLLLRGVYTTVMCTDYTSLKPFALQLTADDIFSRAAYELSYIMINDKTILNPCARPGCKEMLVSIRNTKQYCSDKCRSKAYKEKKKEERHAKKT